MVEFVRKIVENHYDYLRNWIFELTKEDPEVAHEKFIEITQDINSFKLERLLLNNSANTIPFSFEFSNAAGFNKNGDIPPEFLKYLGFNRVVVGTVTHEPWKGNPKPRIWRFPKTKSLVNFLGLPGVGSKEIANNLFKYKSNFIKGSNNIPLTVSIMSTPGKVGDEQLEDLEHTIYDVKFYTDRFELNESCPKVSTCQNKSISEYQKQFDARLKLVTSHLDKKELYVKISPDLTIEQIFETLDVIRDYPSVNGVVGTNTTRVHDPKYVLNSLNKGGASGKAVKHLSVMIQEQVMEEIRNRNMNLKYIAVGGIDSAEEAGYRLDLGADGIQVFTGLIYKGPRLIREIKESYFTRNIAKELESRGYKVIRE